MRSRLRSRRLMALASLWENWRSPAGEWVRSFAIITTVPNKLCAAAQADPDVD
jgi:putative SOS response-associated peptidase YedK